MKFKREEINGDGRCATYLYRWTLCATRWGKLYLHHFVGNDWSGDLHDHPKRFVSIGLRVSYIEQSLDGFRLWRAPWIRSFGATHRHRLYASDCWTLVWVGRPVREWGFWQEGHWIHWSEYVSGPAGDRGQDC